MVNENKIKYKQINVFLCVNFTFCSNLGIVLVWEPRGTDQFWLVLEPAPWICPEVPG